MNIKEHLFENGSLYVLIIVSITGVALGVATHGHIKEEFKAPTKKQDQSEIPIVRAKVQMHENGKYRDATEEEAIKIKNMVRDKVRQDQLIEDLNSEYVKQRIK